MVRVVGERDLAAAPLLRDELVGVANGGVLNVTMDLARLEFVDSTGVSDRGVGPENAFERDPRRVRPLARHHEGMAVDGWLPPWPSWWPPEQLQAMLPDAQLRALVFESSPSVPVSLLTEVLPAAGEDNLGTCCYIRLSAFYEPLAHKAEEAGWLLRRLDAGHMAILTSPTEVVDASETLVREGPARAGDPRPDRGRADRAVARLGG